MQEFCPDSFWNSTLSWDNSWPQLTVCFQGCFLLPLPCYFLLLFLPFHLWHLLTWQPLGSPTMNLLFVLKMLCCAGLMITESAYIGQLVQGHWDETPSSLVYASSMKLASFGLLLPVIFLEWRKCRRQSPGLLLFFLLLLLTHIVPLYSNIILEVYEEETSLFVTFAVNYVAILTGTVLHCFNSRIKAWEVQSPEEGASILSKVTMWWTTSLIISGYKKPLTENDVYPLSTKIRCGTVFPHFLHHLDKEIQKCWQKQSALERAPGNKGLVDYKKARGADLAQKKTKAVSNGEVLDDECGKGDSSAEKDRDVSEKLLDDDEITVEIRTGSTKSGSAETGAGSAFLWKVIFRTFYRSVIFCSVMALIATFFSVMGPLLVKYLILFISDKEAQSWHGYLLAVALFSTFGIAHILSEFFYYQCNKFAVTVNTSILSAVYQKSLRLSSEARQSTSAGAVIQLISSDSNSIWGLCNEMFMLLQCILQFSVGVALVYQAMGVAVFAGLSVLAVLFVIKSITLRKHAQLDQIMKKQADKRLKVITEVLSGIKVLKLYSWNAAFKRLISEIREVELTALFKFDMLGLVITYSWTGAIFWMVFFIFVTHVLVEDDHRLDAATVFVTMAYCTFIRQAVNKSAYVFGFIVTGIVSAKRIGKFLLLKEVTNTEVQGDPANATLPPGVALQITNGQFSWDRSKAPTLNNINLKVLEGSLTAVVGMIGSGKSSLISAMLQEMSILFGTVESKGTTAYVPQEAWIQNDTVKNNILFGSEFDEELYSKVIGACALEPDLAVLPAGDHTEIGERGVNLSGGQKQRISLARATYQQCDLYLMDDPLSAVDSHVGRHIFQNLVGPGGLLKDKTRVMVTHGLHWLTEVDQVVVMTAGQVTEQGSLEQLMQHHGPFAQFLSQYVQQQQQQQPEQQQQQLESGSGDNVQASADEVCGRESSVSVQDAEEEAAELDGDSSEEIRQKLFQRLISVQSSSSEVDEAVGLDAATGTNRNASEVTAFGHTEKDLVKHETEDESSRLIAEEELAHGRVEWSVYAALYRTMGVVPMTIMVLLYISYFVFDLADGFWLTFWVDDPVLSNVSLPGDSELRREGNNYYITTYAMWGILETVVIVVYSVIKAFRHKIFSQSVHADMLDSVLYSPIQFFETTPMGRILARFSKDINVMDMTLFLFIEIWLHSCIGILCILITIVINLPIFLAAAVPIICLFYVLERFYLPTSCQLRRLQSKWLSPVFNHVSESLAGVSVIRALGQEGRFIHLAEDKIDFSQRFKLAAYACERWLSVWLGLLSDVLILCTGVLAVTYRDELTPGLTGLCLSMALIITDQMQLQVRIASMLEMDIVSLERTLQYSNLPSEASKYQMKSDCSRSWPESGNIEFQKVSLRYRPGLDPVLKELTFSIQDGEKIGIVGRTGAGKSSLLIALFRLIEPSAGTVFIDGVDTTKVSLSDLRRHLTILPQDPVLFSGTLWMNLDPLGWFPNTAAEQALRNSHFCNKNSGMSCDLQFAVEEGGENLSVGQRQLVCLARALLRQPKILVLDEATAAVDMETDELIQKTIREEFKSCTVLTIAHRLHTILDYDKVMVLDRGQLVEFDTPASLLADTQSQFYQMAKESRIV
ncbi:multidrug resistance-associated protein 1 isoform X2 [Aplysia californica]|uniref:ABC-type glutathione-S-conjugate transporter n=2 Tax=Aplysia californica TaxID=6500 RepID=A0ABM0JJI2_APLCA|nr:multidrug resistance-associated protein 1 isoform X2 [Aplysia californica]